MTAPDNTSVLIDAATAILDAACECFESVDRQPTNCFVYLGPPPDDGCCDFLVVWLESMQPTTSGLVPESGVVRCADNIRGRANWAVRIMRPCWPALKDNATNPFPSADEMQAAADDVYIDAWLLWCCLLSSAKDGSLFPDSPFACTDIAWGDLRYREPMGGCAGWTMRFSTEIRG